MYIMCCEVSAACQQHYLLRHTLYSKSIKQLCPSEQILVQWWHSYSIRLSPWLHLASLRSCRDEYENSMKLYENSMKSLVLSYDYWWNPFLNWIHCSRLIFLSSCATGVSHHGGKHNFCCLSVILGQIVILCTRSFISQCSIGMVSCKSVVIHFGGIEFVGLSVICIC